MKPIKCATIYINGDEYGEVPFFLAVASRDDGTLFRVDIRKVKGEVKEGLQLIIGDPSLKVLLQIPLYKLAEATALVPIKEP